MPTKIKTFASSRAMPPREWLEAAGAPRHVIQISVLVFSPSKAGAVEGLVFHGAKRSTAEQMVRQMRLDQSESLRLLVDAGVVDPTRAGVYLWRAATADVPVVRVEEGAYVTVGHFRYTRDAGLGAERTPARAGR